MKKAPEKNPQKKTGSRKSRAGRSLKRINLGKISRQLQNILQRDVLRLLEVSYKTPLSPTQSETLLKYIKMVRELEKAPPSALPGDGERYTDEELEQIAAGGKPK